MALQQQLFQPRKPRLQRLLFRQKCFQISPSPSTKDASAAVLLAQAFSTSAPLTANLTTQCRRCTVSLRPRRLLPNECLLTQDARVHLRTGSRA